jgi:succinyl-diaminopimelate desuccinylase
MVTAKEIYDKLLCPGATEAALSASMNVGLINGGLSVNMIPEECTAEVDFRLPPGVSSELLRDWVNRVIQNHLPCSLEEFNSQDALLTDPEEELVKIALETAEETLDRKIHATFSLGGTEARLWRQWGVPSVTYGPNHHNMGSANEYVMAEELPIVTKVQALTALRFLETSEGGPK